MIENSKIGVIILAAGSSSRLGHPKQLVEFKAKTLLQYIIDIADAFKFDSKVLVLGAKADEIYAKTNPKNFKVIINENWQEGMSSSIKKGVSESLKLENELDHILILLSDQPFVSGENIAELIKVQLNENVQATFSEYAGNTGVPAIFSKDTFYDLQKLKGDYGAKKLIQRNILKYQTVKFQKGNFDVDTEKDVELLKKLE